MILFIPIIIILIIFAPLAIIWALNTLFALGIAYTFTNWLATAIIAVAINAGRP